MTVEQSSLVASLSKHNVINPREGGAVVRDVHPGALVSQKDIHNARQRLRLGALGGYTSIQGFVRQLQQRGPKASCDVV